MPKALVFGARGLLGGALVRRLPAAGFEVVALDHAACDITDADAVNAAFDQHEPAFAFNAVADNDVDGLERDPARGIATNVMGPALIATAAFTCDARFVHYSTDFVFDGALDRAYREDDPPRPVNGYGRSKAAGEKAVLTANPQALVLRVAWLFGKAGRNFPSRILPLLRAGTAIRGDGERSGAPTWVDDVARVSAAAAQSSLTGLLHVAAHGETTWLEVARRMARALGGGAEALVTPAPTSGLGLQAPRAKRIIFDTSRLHAAGLDTMPTWQDGLAAFLRDEGLA